MMTQERSWTALTISEREVFMDRPLTRDFAEGIGAVPMDGYHSLTVDGSLKLDLRFYTQYPCLVSVYRSGGMNTNEMVTLGDFETCGQLLALLDVLASVNDVEFDD